MARGCWSGPGLRPRWFPHAPSARSSIPCAMSGQAPLPRPTTRSPPPTPRSGRTGPFGFTTAIVRRPTCSSGGVTSWTRSPRPWPASLAASSGRPTAAFPTGRAPAGSPTSAGSTTAHTHSAPTPSRVRSRCSPRTRRISTRPAMRAGLSPPGSAARSTSASASDPSARSRCGSGKLWRMDDKVNLAQKIGLLDQPYSPGIVGYLNDYKLVVVRVKGEFVWHKHDDTDDFFLVLRGRLTIQLRDRDVELSEGELFVVPRGVEHCPKADEDTHVLLIEPRGTVNTGDAGGELTAHEVEI